MSTHDTRKEEDEGPASKIAAAGGTWGHTWSPGGQGQTPEDAARERARRAGRRTKDWWKKYLPPDHPDGTPGT